VFSSGEDGERSDLRAIYSSWPGLFAGDLNCDMVDQCLQVRAKGIASQMVLASCRRGIIAGAIRCPNRAPQQGPYSGTYCRDSPVCRDAFIGSDVFNVIPYSPPG